MRKILALITAAFLAAAVYGCRSGEVMERTQRAQVYFVDSRMLRLVPTDVWVSADKQRAAQEIADIIVRGMDSNKSVRRYIPKLDGALTVKVEGEIAYVDISREAADKHPQGRDAEVLTVYSIVNSITSVEGIVNVRFTVGGERTKDFAGFLDMRETFIPDYYV